MYSRITQIYYRKTVGHVFTKPVQKEGKTQFFFSSKLFFIVVHISAARQCECFVVGKWPLRGRIRFVCWNITRISLWILCKVFVPPLPRDLADLKIRIIATVKNIDAPMCGKNLNVVSMCAMSPVVHKSNISRCRKNFFSFPVAVNSSTEVFLWFSCYKCL